MDTITVGDLAPALNDRIDELSHHLIGEPNRSMSTRQQLRFGTHGSVAVEIDGPGKGQWYDHENGCGGDGLELVCQRLGLANGAACDWARDWLGLPAHRPAAEVADIPPPSWHKPDRSKEDLAAKVADIVAGCGPIKGTPAETYLRLRGITASPLPPCLRFRPNAFNHYGALVALSTDAAGNVLAVQQNYLTADGRKAGLKVQKRTNKARDGWSDVAAVRLPGTPPLVLCEGVETALSVWQATGYETWACLGISNIARAPVPDDASIIIARDGDEPNSKADQQLRKAATILRGMNRDVTVAMPPAGKDFNDVLQAGGDQAVRDLIMATVAAETYSRAWRNDLLFNDEGEPRPVLANAILALRQAPEWDGVLWHNEFATATIARKPPPWIADPTGWQDTPWADRDDFLVADWLQHQDIMVPASIAGQAVEVVARDRLFHPVREYLDGLVWDGAGRIDTWLSAYVGAEDTPYVRAVGARWLVSAVARIYNPGAKADCALILEGPQGIRKSTALKVLGDPWFADRLSDLGSKDAAMETKGVWIIEVAELDTMSRAEVGTIKAFMSRTHDRFRPPYGKRLVDLPRQCVFAGSINPEGGYLKDASGGRRFWPIVCGVIDIEALKRDRDQLWAEARHQFQAGAPWWLDTPDLNALANEQQADRYQGDAWDDPIRLYLDNEVRWVDNGFGERHAYVSNRAEPLDDVSVAEIMEKALGMDKGRWTQADQNRVVRCLITMGFRQYRARIGGQRERRYRRDRLEG